MLKSITCDYCGYVEKEDFTEFLHVELTEGTTRDFCRVCTIEMVVKSFLIHGKKPNDLCKPNEKQT